MYVSIHARNDLFQQYDRSIPGKSTWVEVSEYELSVRHFTPKQADPDWRIEIRADMWDERGNENSEAYKCIWRELSLVITPADLQKIVNLALEQRLLCLAVKQADISG